MKKLLFIIICAINTHNIYSQINEIFPFIVLGMEYNDLKEKITYKNSMMDYGFYFGDIRFGSESGYYIYDDDVKRPKILIIDFITLFDFYQTQSYHFNEDKLVGCSAGLYFFSSAFDKGPVGYDFDKVYNELLIKLTRLFGDFKTVYDGHIDSESLHNIPLEFHKDRINFGGAPYYDYLTLKSVDINKDKLYIAFWKVDKISELEKDTKIPIPEMNIYYGTEYFYNKFRYDFSYYGVDENEDSESVLYEQNEEQNNVKQDYNAKKPVFLIICGLVILFAGCVIILFIIYKKRKDYSSCPNK